MSKIDLEKWHTSQWTGRKLRSSSLMMVLQKQQHHLHQHPAVHQGVHDDADDAHGWMSVISQSVSQSVCQSVTDSTLMCALLFLHAAACSEPVRTTSTAFYLLSTTTFNTYYR